METNARRDKFVRWFLAIAWSVLFLYLLIVFSPSGTRLASLAGSWSQMLGLPPGTLFKLGHVGGYLVWILLWCGVLAKGYRRPLPRAVLPWLPMVVLIMAALPEGLQRLNPDRHPTWMDVGYNSIGAVVGLALRVVVVKRK